MTRVLCRFSRSALCDFFWSMAKGIKGLHQIKPQEWCQKNSISLTTDYDWLLGINHLESNDQGIIRTGNFKSEDGFNAILTFNYNCEGLLSGINWDFSFGKFQQYWFEYEPVNPD